MKLPIKRILAQANEDYEEAWLNSNEYLKMKGNLFNLEDHGKAHPLKKFIQESREELIKLGFEELVLPMFVHEDDVYKEYGPEAALILDRLYYLAGLPRPDIGVSKNKLEKIKQIVPDFSNVDGLQEIFRRYKKGDIESDDLIETLVKELNMEEHDATRIIDNVFPEFKDLVPIPSKQTLRSHTTALWFLVMAEMVHKRPLPIQYFIVGPKFRREQKQDATHLFVSNTLSIAIAAEEISLEDGKRIGKKIAQAIGFDDVKVETKLATSKYYAPQTEFEIFGQHPITKEWIEIGDGGFYAPVSLAKFGIDVPILNIGFGCERITMIRTQETDIRRLVYPYFYKEMEFTDAEIASFVKCGNKPVGKKAKDVVDELRKFAVEHKDEKGPVEKLAWEGELNGKTVKIYLNEPDKGATLLGKASLNELWAKDGNIISVAHGGTLEEGVKSDFTYLDGILNEIVSRAEGLSKNKGLDLPYEENFRYRFVKRLSEVNLDIDDKVRDFITSKSKKIDVIGPVFIGAKIQIE